MSLKTIRFGPLEGYGKWSGNTFKQGPLGEDGFPPGTYEDIPDDTNLRIEMLPRRTCIFSGKVTHSYSQNFDPGKYIYKLKINFPVTEDAPKPRCFAVDGVFLVDVTEEQYRNLRDMQPRMARGSMTSDGPVWTCSAPGCQKKTKTRIAAFLHESREHYGIDPLKDPTVGARIQAGLVKPSTDKLIEEVDAKERQREAGRKGAAKRWKDKRAAAGNG